MNETTLFAAKGGQGVSTTAAALAIRTARNGCERNRVALIVPDENAVSEMASDFGQGASDSDALFYAWEDVGGYIDIWAEEAWATTNLRGGYHFAIRDAGVLRGPEYPVFPGRNFLVTRNCYKALRAGLKHALPHSGVILVKEDSRSLGLSDVEAVLGNVVTVIPIDDAVGRAVDAGLLPIRIPSSLERALTPILPPVRIAS